MLLVMAAAALYFFYLAPQQKINREKEMRDAASAARSVLIKKVLLDPALIIYDKSGFVRAKMPLRHDAGSLLNLFKKEMSAYPAAEIKADEKRADGSVKTVLSVVMNNTELLKAELIKNPGPKIVVILDDWGYNKRDFKFLSSIKQVYNCAVLPGLRYSQQAFELARASKKGVILHLPMQPKGIMPMEKTTILSGMNRNAVTSIIKKNFEAVGNPFGANNHEGSLVTSDSKVMSYVMEYFASKNLFFIDSRTASDSVAEKEARKAGVLFAGRDVFLDNSKEKTYIAGQMQLLKKEAKKKGYAVGIGHDYPSTLEVLQELMPKFEAEGYEFVYTAEVVN